MRHPRFVPGIRRLASISCVAVAVLVNPSPAVAQKETFPEDGGSAYQLYEVDMPVDKWLTGPVEYIVLRDESDIWKDLDDDAERRDFVEWFWARRDIDFRDEAHPYRVEFYERVAFANQRFHGFPRGWRSDRGRVLITLGRPTGGMRRTSLERFGRCSAENGEWWTYYTNNMAFSNSFGEFNVIFVERRIGQYEVCDPSMLGMGAWPVDLQRALEITALAAVVDGSTEFDPDVGVVEASAPDVITDAVSSVEGLGVPLDGWGDVGAGGVVVVPVELPLRKLLFEPGETTLTANLQVEATLIPAGGESDIVRRGAWRIELSIDAASSIGGASLRSALVVPAPPGGYSVRVRLIDPLSASAWVWDGAVEVMPDVTAASQPLVGHHLLARGDGGVAVLAPNIPILRQGEEFGVVSFVRGWTPDPADVTVTLIDAAGVESPLQGATVSVAEQPGDPLIVRGTVSGLAAGTYELRLRLSADTNPLHKRVRVQ